MFIMIDDWHDLKKWKRAYLRAIENDTTIPVDQTCDTVQHNGRLWLHVISIWKDGKSTGEYIPLCDTCGPEIEW